MSPHIKVDILISGTLSYLLPFSKIIIYTNMTDVSPPPTEDLPTPLMIYLVSVAVTRPDYFGDLVLFKGELNCHLVVFKWGNKQSICVAGGGGHYTRLL